jgi:hypothetical protein
MVTTAPAQTSATSARKRAPWRGRPRAANPKGKRIALRCTVEDYALIAEWAAEAGLSIGGYLRALALGSAGPRAKKRPQAERDLLARILGELGKLGSNVNQSAKWSNIEQAAPSFAELVKMREDIALMRAAVLQALARGDDRGD